MACGFCDVPIYTKIKKFSKSLAAPVTPEGALRQRVEDLTGETYAVIEHRFCPMCGQYISGGMYDREDKPLSISDVFAEGKNKTGFLFSRRNKNE